MPRAENGRATGKSQYHSPFWPYRRVNHKRLRKHFKASPEIGRWLKFHKQKTKSMYRQIPDMTEEQRFEQYRTELGCVVEIVGLWREEHAQRACNRLAEHVRQQAKISSNAEHAILIIEQQAREIRELKTALADEVSRGIELRGELERGDLQKKYATAFEGLTKIIQGVEDPQQVAAAYAQTCVDA